MRPLPLAPTLAAALVLAGCLLPGSEPGVPYPLAVLAGDPFTDLIVEIDHAPGREPSVAAREHLVKELRNITQKTRVTILVEQTLRDEPAKRWTLADLIAQEASTRTTTHAAPVALIHVLYPAGEYENASAAGITITGPAVPTVTVFLDTIEQLRSPLGPVQVPREALDEVESATLLHEAGHAVGLVNNGIPMVRDHEDREHPGHSSNERSVMWHRVETLAGIREALLHDGELPLYFDEDDRADIRAAGGK